MVVAIRLLSCYNRTTNDGRTQDTMEIIATITVITLVAAMTAGHLFAFRKAVQR